MADVIEFVIDAKDKTGAAMGAAVSGLKSMAEMALKAAAAAAASGAAIVAFVDNTADAMGKQIDFANRIGESVTALTEYQFAAKMSGIESDRFNQAVQGMTKRVSEAAQGTGEAVGVLGELGITASSFTNLPLDQKLQTLAQKMTGVQSNTDRLRIATKLFGDEGASMLQMLNEGGDAMAAAAADARFLGVAIGEDAATQAANFGDKMDRAKSAITGLGYSISGALMPLIGGLADRFANFIASNRANFARMAEDAAVYLFMVWEVAKQVWDQLSKVFTDPHMFVVFLGHMGDLALKMGVAALATGKALAVGILTGINLAKDMLNTFGGWIGRSLYNAIHREKIEDLGAVLGEGLETGLTTAFDKMKVEANDLQGVLSLVAQDAAKDLEAGFNIDLDKAHAGARATIQGLSADLTKVGETAQATGVIVQNGVAAYRKPAEALRESYDGFFNWAWTAAEQFQASMWDMAYNGIEAVSDQVAQAIVDGTSLVDVFRNVAKQMVQQLIAALIKLGIQRLIFSGMQSAMLAKEGAQQASLAVGLAGANMFASWALAPWPISMGAPAAAAEAVVGASSAFTAGAAVGAGLGASVGAVAHGGMTHNAQEQTILVTKGERIISPRQNADLTAALESGGIGGGASFGDINISVMPNATSGDALAAMPTSRLARLLEDAVLMALDNLDRRGVRPAFAGRRA